MPACPAGTPLLIACEPASRQQTTTKTMMATIPSSAFPTPSQPQNATLRDCLQTYWTISLSTRRPTEPAARETAAAMASKGEAAATAKLQSMWRLRPPPCRGRHQCQASVQAHRPQLGGLPSCHGSAGTPFHQRRVLLRLRRQSHCREDQSSKGSSTYRPLLVCPAGRAGRPPAASLICAPPGLPCCVRHAWQPVHRGWHDEERNGVQGRHRSPTEPIVNDL